MAWPDMASPYERRSIIRGMRVRDEEGTFLGYVALLSGVHIYVRPWPFSRRWGQLPMSRVRHVTPGTVVLEGRGPADAVTPELYEEITTQTLPLVEPGAART
ncbi:hypothetical protein HUA74_08110 [Myxococcus sp. CA051A]|uniref:hypothetical protein n=1 Tax=unclassified Myxococcus TaxID=2648731 RepID=UPI00157A7C82|nr:MULTISPECIES: hypothetical protein [unclassified Myxococcus]NTX11349.1 hypothetical protein [Myxococcus sp. CA056]NTX34551.1 hypothetical protein [Myxococcus sp. CA033]NTX55237.1 hypothetical protein [Myxococcus sp. CA039A]NTX60621.1 hypothetical protein [Myxococcus sp. CA051A]